MVIVGSSIHEMPMRLNYPRHQTSQTRTGTSLVLNQHCLQLSSIVRIIHYTGRAKIANFSHHRQGWHQYSECGVGIVLSSKKIIEELEKSDLKFERKRNPDIRSRWLKRFSSWFHSFEICYV
eukprot:scaffold22589_cov138-Cylindrotheca_fusiformis.AAC.40